MRSLYVILPVVFAAQLSMACQCPPIALTKEGIARYDIIFKGVVKEVKPCGGKPGEALFTVEELFRGNIARTFSVIFECDGECSKGFGAGEEWIIYSNYKQISNAKMDWCSRSRKFFRHEQEDYYKVNTGVDYFDELAFLRKALGLHRPTVVKQNAAGNRNELPGGRQSLLLVLCSLAGIVLFYILFRKFFR